MTQNADQPQGKKIIVDEDWKAQVEAEKEAAKQPAEEPAAKDKAEATARPKGPLPPPSLILLATSLGMQAMVAMGLVAAPDGEKPEVDLDETKHVIGMLDMLWQKTEGNRTAEETAMLDSLLHELRLGYVAVQDRQKAAK
jgi:hypothetical protein